MISIYFYYNRNVEYRKQKNETFDFLFKMILEAYKLKPCDEFYALDDMNTFFTYTKGENCSENSNNQKGQSNSL